MDSAVSERPVQNSRLSGSLRRRGSVLAVLVAMVAALLPQFGAGTTVFAALFEPTEFTVVSDRTTIVQGSPVTIGTEVDGCIPASANPDDTFELGLPAVLADWPAGFNIDDAGGTIFVVTITGAPATAVFTLTAYGAGLQNGCFSANFGARASAAAEGEYPLDYTLNGTPVPNPQTLTVGPPDPDEIPTEPAKVAFFRIGGDQCRTTTDRCLNWVFATPGGNNGSVSFVDVAQPSWAFECGTFRVQIITVENGGETAQTIPFADVVSGDSCSPTDVAFDVDTTGLADNQYINVRVQATATVAGGDGGITYENAAEATVNGTPSSISTSASSSYVGGIGQGDGILIEKRDSAGNDADTEQEQVTTDDGNVDLVFTIRNVGTNDLNDVIVSDLVTEGTALVSDLTCDFSALGGPTTGTTWDGPFESTDAFNCTATLSGVSGLHTNVATVTAIGNDDVSDDDPFNAFTEVPDVPSVSVGDFVWFDTNADGLQDGEDGIEDVTLTLTGPDGMPVTDIFGNPVAPTTTDADGLYTFDNLPVLDADQSYTVTVTPPAGLIPTTPEVDPANGSSTDTATSTGLTEDGERDPTLDFGFTEVPDVPSVSVGDFVFIDTNGDGVQDASDVPVPGATLTLTGPDGETVTDVLGNPVGPVVTGPDGLYSFDNLPVLEAGQSYTVTIDPSTAPVLAGLTPTLSGQGTSATDSSTGSASSIELVADGDRDDTLDFGFVPLSTTLPATGSALGSFLAAAFTALLLGLATVAFTRRRRTLQIG